MSSVIIKKRYRIPAFQLELIKDGSELIVSTGRMIRLLAVDGMSDLKKVKSSNSIAKYLSDIDQFVILNNDDTVSMWEQSGLRYIGNWPLELRSEQSEELVYCGNGLFASSFSVGITLFDINTGAYSVIYENEDIFPHLLQKYDGSLYFLEQNRNSDPDSIKIKKISIDGSLEYCSETNRKFPFSIDGQKLIHGNRIFFWANYVNEDNRPDRYYRSQYYIADFDGNTVSGVLTPEYTDVSFPEECINDKYLVVNGFVRHPDIFDYMEAIENKDVVLIYNLQTKCLIGELTGSVLNEKYKYSCPSALTFISENEFFLGTWNEILHCCIVE